MPLGADIAIAAIPSVINGLSNLFTGKSNQSYYERMQQKANEFAREERQLTQNYNSLENQFAQMANVGMNPNLLTGNAFVASSPMPNQSVSPPQITPPQVPADSLSQTKLAESQSKNLDANTMTEDLLRDNKFAQSFASVRLTDSQEGLNNALRDMSVSERENLFRKFRNLDASTEQIYANTRLTESQTEFSKAQTASQHIQNSISRAFGYRTAEAAYNKICSDIAVNAEQRAFLSANKDLALELVGLRKKENKLFHDTYKDRVHMFQFEAEGRKIGLGIQRTTADQLEFDFSQCKTYDDVERCTRLANGFLDATIKLQNANPIDHMVDKSLNRFSKLTGVTKGADPSVSSPYGSGGFSSSLNF